MTSTILQSIRQAAIHADDISRILGPPSSYRLIALEKAMLRGQLLLHRTSLVVCVYVAYLLLLACFQAVLAPLQVCQTTLEKL